MALGAAILAVLFVGTGDSGSAAPPVTTSAETTTAPTTSAPTTTAETTTTIAGQPTTTFTVPDTLIGDWSNGNDSARATFEGLEITSLSYSDDSRQVLLAEPAKLAAVPSKTLPVQAVLLVQVAEGDVVTAPQPVIAELIGGDAGLLVTLFVDGAEVTFSLLPGP